MNKYQKMIRGFILLVVSCSWLISQKVFAAEESQSATGFSVESIMAENQVDIRKTYFYLKMTPSQPQVIQVKIRSTQVEPVTVKLGIHNAISSSVGAIDYAKTNPTLDKSLKNPITELVTINDNLKEVTVENFEERIIEYTIQPPAEAFSGVKLGSLRFVKKEGNSESDNDEQSGLASQYAYVIALMLTEDGERFNLGADLKLTDVDLKLSNGRKVVAATIQNDQPKVMREMVIEGRVQRKGDTKVLAKNSMTDFSVAPNSNFDFKMPLDLNDFSPVTYVFTGKAEADGKVWNWKEEFTVSGDTARKVNKETVFKLVIPGWAPWMAAGLVLALLVFLMVLIRRQRQW